MLPPCTMAASTSLAAGVDSSISNGSTLGWGHATKTGNIGLARRCWLKWRVTIPSQGVGGRSPRCLRRVGGCKLCAATGGSTRWAECAPVNS